MSKKKPMAQLTREKYFSAVHEKNLPSFRKIVKMISNGTLRIMDIRVGAEEFGNTRIVMFVNEAKK